VLLVWEEWSLYPPMLIDAMRAALENKRCVCVCVCVWSMCVCDLPPVGIVL